MRNALIRVGIFLFICVFLALGIALAIPFIIWWMFTGNFYLWRYCEFCAHVFDLLEQNFLQ